MEIAQQELNQKIITPGQLVFKRFIRNKLAIMGMVILVIMFIFSFIGPFFSPYGEYTLFFEKNGVEQMIEEGFNYDEAGVKVLIKNKPSIRHWLGTDAHGRDIFTRLMYGGRISLLIGFVVVAIKLLIGVTLGGLAGFYGKWVDSLIMRIVDIFNCIPFFPVMLIISSMMLVLKIPQEMQIYVLMAVMGSLGWTGIARMVRGQILSLREQEFMVATQATGIKASKRIFKHLIPNVMPQLIVISTMGIGSVILTESSLSFLGLGVKFPLASWGNMVSAVNDPIILKQYAFIWVPAGVAILLTVLAFNFVGDGLRDAYDPKMKR
ncbi:MAG: ABC transporter permease [Oscillospiraceae bacterium]